MGMTGGRLVNHLSETTEHRKAEKRLEITAADTTFMWAING
jgi:hypothetical protein